jgi:hypothetical protein
LPIKLIATYLSFLLVVLTNYSSAQNPNHFIIGEEELAGVHIYTLLYDDITDILYAGTDAGVYAYKQNHFTLLEKPNVAIGNSFFDLKKSPSGEIYCCNLHGQLFTVTETGYKLFCAFPANGIYSYFSFSFSQNDIIGIGSSLMTYDVEDKSFAFLDNDPENKLRSKRAPYLTISEVRDSSLFIATIDGSGDIIEYVNNETVVVHKRPGSIAYRAIHLMNNQYVLCSKEGNYTLLNREEKLTNMVPPQFMERSCSVSENSILAMGTNSGFRIITLSNDTLFAGPTNFSDEIISSFCQSSEDCFFFGTFGNGIKVVPSLETLKYKIGSQLSGIAAFPENDVAISSYDGEIITYSNEKLEAKIIAKLKVNIDEIFYIPSAYPEAIQKNLVYSYLESTSAIRDLEVIDSTSLIFCNEVGLTLYSTNKNLYPNLKPKKNNGLIRVLLPEVSRVSSVTLHDDKQSAFYSNNFGVFKFNLNNSQIDTIKLDGHIFQSTFVEFYEGQLFCAIENRGILIFENGRVVKSILIKDGLFRSWVKKMEIKNGVLYILTTKGIQIYDLNLEKFIPVGVSGGIINNSKIINFSLSNDQLWLLEKKGFYSIPFQKTRTKQKISKLYIDSICVNGKAFDWERNSSFSHTENAIDIYFDYRNLPSKNETTITYTLEGFYDDWKTLPASENKIEFQSLPPGEYTFHIKAKFLDQETKTFTYHFIISPPYWQTWWFISIVFLIIVIGTLFYGRIRLKRQKVKMELINQANASKLTAIQSQMNPHFIFNALNSIQALVLKGDIDNSYTYINKFSSLVRKTLNYSKFDFIEIESEIKLLEIYLSLEKMRFREDFEFTISIPEFDEISVPPMLIQPFVENALVHGLMHKEGLKKLSLRFEMTDVITCIIEDNGIGRSAAKEINERQRAEHESFALESIAARLEILSKHTNHSIGYEYHDLTKDGSATGTRVTIRIPYIMNSF